MCVVVLFAVCVRVLCLLVVGGFFLGGLLHLNPNLHAQCSR